jgi:hypothetical protein
MGGTGSVHLVLRKVDLRIAIKLAAHPRLCSTSKTPVLNVGLLLR